MSKQSKGISSLLMLARAPCCINEPKRTRLTGSVARARVWCIRTKTHKCILNIPSRVFIFLSSSDRCFFFLCCCFVSILLSFLITMNEWWESVILFHLIWIRYKLWICLVPVIPHIVPCSLPKRCRGKKNKFNFLFNRETRSTPFCSVLFFFFLPSFFLSSFFWGAFRCFCYLHLNFLECTQHNRCGR